MEIVAWEDGSIGCVAQVSAPGQSFSIWTYSDGTLRVHFYSSGWQVGEGKYADVQMQIDNRAPWMQSGAELNKNSVLFYRTDDGARVDFIVEVARGNRLYLRDADGNDVKDYSLAGSSASIVALIECGTVIGR